MAGSRDNAIDADTLHGYVQRGIESVVLRQRLRYAEAEGFRKFVAPLATVERVYPDILPIQASGRWSTKNPPVVGMPDDAKADAYGLPRLRSIFVPDPGTWWLCWDWDGIHARIMAAACNDVEDLKAYQLGLDEHTLTACRIFGLPLPPNPKNPHTSPECQDWRDTLGWKGKGDRRRHLAKVVRYALLNGLDERAVLEAKDVERQGLTYPELLRAGKAFLTHKPAMPAWKRTFVAEALKARCARSAITGRRRMLFGPPDECAKTAVSHFLQGTEVDVMEATVIEVVRHFPAARLKIASHDGLKIQFPCTLPIAEVYGVVRPIAERAYPIGPNTITFTATWEVLHDDGTKEALP